MNGKPMKRRTKWIASGAIAAALLTGATGIAVASGAAESESPITGEALGRASDAALAHTGGGRVSETEAGDEDGAYEVEVTLADGRQVDVHLDPSFTVIGQVADTESPGDADTGGR